MRGLHEVPLSRLVDELRTTVEEREQMVAGMKMGVEGPYRFGDASWEEPSDIVGL